MSPLGSTPESRLASSLLGIAAAAAGDLVFYDDFETGGGDWLTGALSAKVCTALAVRDVTKHVSRPITIDNKVAPIALVSGSLNQAGTAQWELSWDNSTWVAGDAGTAIAAGATVIVPPNSRTAPMMRITFTATVAPTAGSLTILVSEARPLWEWSSTQAGGTGERNGYVRRAPEHVFSGSFGLEMMTCDAGQAIGDTVMATRHVPIPKGQLLEFGALVHLPAWDWAGNPDRFTMNLTALADNIYPSFTIRVETGVISYQDVTGAWVATVLNVGTGYSRRWHDLRLGVDPSSGRYLYIEANGKQIGLAVSAPPAAAPNPSVTGPHGFVQFGITTTQAATEAAVIDRAILRRIQ